MSPRVTTVEHTDEINGMCAMISVPFEESVNIEREEEKSFPLECFLFKQVESAEHADSLKSGRRDGDFHKNTAKRDRNHT